MRGTASEWSEPATVVGITPACAGNRDILRGFVCRIGDHPRVCGEQHAELFGVTVIIGSPPRVRGTVQAAGEGLQKMRITPACAGNRYLSEG